MEVKMFSLPRKAKMSQYPSDHVQEIRMKGYYVPFIDNAYADIETALGDPTTIERDWTVFHVLNTMSLQSAGEFLMVEHPNPRLVHILTYMLQNIKGFTRVRKALVHKGTCYGLSLAQKTYSEREIPYTGMSWLMIESLQEVDRKRLRLEREDGDDRTNLYWTIWSPRYDNYIILENLNKNPYAPRPFSTQDYVWFIYDYEEEYPYFYGLSDILYPLCKIKIEAIQYWHQLAEKWGEKTLIAKMNVMKGTIDEATEIPNLSISKRKEILMKALRNMLKEKVVIVDKDDEISSPSPSASGTNIIKELAEYIDNKIHLLVLGAELTTKSGKSGSYALGSIHKEMTTSQIVYNRSILIDSLKEFIIKDFMLRNRQALKRLGIELSSYNAVRLNISSEKEQLKVDLAKQGIVETRAGIKDI